MTNFALKEGLGFSDLYDRNGLVRVDRAFVAHLAAVDTALHDRLMAARRDPEAVSRPDESDLLVELAPHVEDFLGELFGIAGEVQALQARHHELAPLYSVKRLFVQRRAVKGVKEPDAAAIDGAALAHELDVLIGGPFDDVATWERRYAEHVGRWLEDEAGNAAALDKAQRYAAWATLSPDGRKKHLRGVLFQVPHRLDMNHLVPVKTIERDGVTMLHLPEDDWRHREGFALTDHGTDLTARSIRRITASGATIRAKTAAPKGSRKRTARLKRASLA
jgi:hypothetical protein